MAVRRALHAAGLRFRVNDRRLPGRPDIVLSRVRLAVFIDGCFWHACPEHGVMPKNNRGWWRQKLEANVERDRRKDAQLRDQGWFPLHFWEHEAVEDIAARIERLWRERTGRPA
jgi:DNA mismatch endonuclease (patch repair protein)